LPRANKRWSSAEQYLLLRHVGIWTPRRIAQALGRTEKGVGQYCQQHGIWPCKQRWLTSGAASLRCGLSPQYLTQLARAGRQKAHRNPGGRWWLFDTAAVQALAERRRVAND